MPALLFGVATCAPAASQPFARTAAVDELKTVCMPITAAPAASASAAAIALSIKPARVTTSEALLIMLLLVVVAAVAVDAACRWLWFPQNTQ